MQLFQTLERKQRFTFFNSGSENRFFLARTSVLNSVPGFHELTMASKPFDVIRANIVIRALINKRALDQAYITTARQYRKDGEIPHDGEIAIKKAVEAVKKDLPYLELGEDKIYIPILPRSINTIYDRRIMRLEEKPMKALLGERFDVMVVDPFITYGAELFNSYFTNLIRVAEHDGVVAYFDYDSLAIYFVNKSGYLDVNICLFDRGIGRRNLNHMLERITPVIDAYFRDDREGLMESLVQNQLISSSLIYKINSKEIRFNERLEREIER